LPPSSKNRRKPYAGSIELWPEQEGADDFVLEREASALFFEQRTGKTFITLRVLDRLPRENMAVVLVCLLNNKDSTWRHNLTSRLPWLNVTEDWEKFKALPFPKLLLVHFESLHPIAKKLQKPKWITFAIIDEAHRLKARGTRLSRAAAKLYQLGRKRLILTGTPIEKQPKDLWAQFRFLAPDVFGSWREFEDEFLDVAKIDMTGVKPGTARWQIKVMQQGMLRSRAPFKWEKLPQLLEMIKPYALRMTKRDAGILEPIIRKVSVPIVGEQRRLYDRMKKHSVVRLDDGSRAIAPLTVTNIVKRRQLASGFIYDDDGECHYVGDAKLRKLLRLFDRLPKPIAIFAVFTPEIEAIAKALRKGGYRIATVTGATKKRERPKIWQGFQKARYDGIVCQTRVGGTGVDLWKGDYAIAHSISHSSIDFDQMKSRMDAKGKEKAATIYVLCGSATIDDDLYDMVVEKGLTSEEVLKQLKKGAK
jgi:superfamily II DNA or RNA helicase